MFQVLYRLMIELTNRKWSSIILRNFSQSASSRFVVPFFSKSYQINVEEMEKPLKEYGSLHELFIRKLKEGKRPVDDHSFSVVSPVDAVLEETGTISADLSITVKDKQYSIIEMLGKEEKVLKYQNGMYMIFYLSPSHYHRIHSPLSGEVLDQWVLGDKSYPVNKLGLKYGDRTLSKNYRMITEVKHSCGQVAIVKVGAMFVNSIETIHEGDRIQKGEEMAYFTFGSTVVLLFEKDTIELLETIRTPLEIKMGERIGFLANERIDYEKEKPCT